jgi:hypothetical protein
MNVFANRTSVRADNSSSASPPAADAQPDRRTTRTARRTSGATIRVLEPARSRRQAHGLDPARPAVDARTRLARDTRLVVRGLLRGVLFMLAVSLPVGILLLDIKGLGNAVGEISATELTQLACLAAIAASFGWLARASEPDRRFAVLAAGFFACMLIRELDALLDLVADGLWQALVATVAAACVAYAAMDWRQALHGMARLMASRAALVMSLGLALLLAYSRLLGMGHLWRGVLGDGYERIVKNAIEEGAELLGYTVILVASLGYLGRRLQRLRRR